MLCMPAGFDCLSKRIDTAPGNYVVTGNLFNCIAIAAFNNTYKRMAIAHFTTAQCAESVGESYVHDAAILRKWRSWLIMKTGANEFCIGLGSLYGGAIKEEIKADLVTKVKAAFNYQPVHVGRWARFGFDNNGQAVMESSDAPSWLKNAEEEWKTRRIDHSRAGDLIPYHELSRGKITAPGADTPLVSVRRVPISP